MKYLLLIYNNEQAWDAITEVCDELEFINSRLQSLPCTQKQKPRIKRIGDRL